MKIPNPSSTILLLLLLLLSFSTLLLLTTAEPPSPPPPEPPSPPSTPPPEPRSPPPPQPPSPPEPQSPPSPPSPPPPSPPSPLSCSDELVKFSVCLPYIASPPNNLTNTPPQQCCEDFATPSTSNHSSVCLCYFIHQPLILGFPINSSRLLAIPTFCPNGDYSPRPTVSLDSLCSGSAELPPLYTITGPDDGQQIIPPEEQSQDAGPPEGNIAPEPCADSPAGPQHGPEESLPQQQSQDPGDYDDDIAPEPTADSQTKPKSGIPTSSRASTTLSMKNRCRCVPLSFLLLYLQCYALSL